MVKTQKTQKKHRKHRNFFLASFESLVPLALLGVTQKINGLRRMATLSTSPMPKSDERSALPP